MPIALTAYALTLIVALTSLVLLYRAGMLSAVAMLLYLCVLLLIRPLTLFSGLDMPQPANAFDDVALDAALALLAALLWIGLFTLCALAMRAYLPRLGAAFLPRPVSTPDPARLRLFAAGLALLAGAITAGFVLQSGSPGAFIYRVKVAREMSGLFLFLHLAVLSLMLSLYGLLEEIRRAETPARRRSAFLFYAPLLLIAMGASFAWGNRGNIAYILIAGALSWHVLIAPLRPIRVLIGAAILFVALFAMGNLREARLEALTGTPYSERSLTRSLSNSLHLAEFDALSLAIKDAGNRYELREGADFRNGILAMVPRQILPERQIFNVGGWFRQVYEPGKVNGWPVTVIGDWFVNFGWIGVVLGAALSGAVAGLFDSAYSRVSSRTWDAVLAPVLGILILKGGVGTGAPQQIVLTLIPLAILSLALRLRGETGRASARWRSGEA
ncbi:hypothetical protein BMG00_06825 [Thioclava marina]|uniref:Oligosaccharide repeat unit polymerase n=1 Tax=Thioclava marina TaxID=1915077 RepID=A0ABX3MPL1_9RHOB|nr:hypothetical protein BMG00_06825 [Thioclava marina]